MADHCLMRISMGIRYSEVALHGKGYSIGGLTRYPISPSATIAIRPTSMILLMLKTSFVSRVT